VTAAADPVVSALRDEIAALDVRLLGTVNERVAKVAELKRYKDEHGIAFLDPEREAWLVDHLQRANGGPLSADHVEELLRFVLDLTKRQTANG
jgi:chorismate mutase